VIGGASFYLLEERGKEREKRRERIPLLRCRRGAIFFLYFAAKEMRKIDGN